MSGKRDGRNVPSTSSNKKKKRRKKKDILCNVWHLDNKQMSIELDKPATGNDLFNAFLAKLDPISEDGYFGLYFPHTDPLEWVTDEPLKKQTDIRKPVIVEFGVRYFPPKPSKIVSPHTKYLLYLQLKENLATGRFKCPEHVATQLCALSVQADLGDFNEQMFKRSYLSNLMLLPNQDRVEEEIEKWHRALEKMTFTEAIQTFLSLSAKQDLYGVDLFQVKEKSQKHYIGVHARGLTVFTENLKVLHKHKWKAIAELLFEKENFVLFVKPALKTQSLHRVEFTCETKKHSRALWAAAVQQHTFFRRTSQPKVQVRSKLGRFMSAKSQYPLRKARVNISGKTEYETREKALRSSTSKSLTFARTGTVVKGNTNTPRRHAYENISSETFDSLYKHTSPAQNSLPVTTTTSTEDEGRQRLIDDMDTYVSLSKRPSMMDSSKLKSFHSEDIQAINTADTVVAKAITFDFEPERRANFVDVSDLPPLIMNGGEMNNNVNEGVEINVVNDNETDHESDNEDSTSNIVQPFLTPQRHGTVENLEPDVILGKTNFDKQQSNKLLMTATPIDRTRPDFTPLSPLTSDTKPPLDPMNAFTSNNGSFIGMSIGGEKDTNSSSLNNNNSEDRGSEGEEDDGVASGVFRFEADPLVEERPIRGTEVIEFPKKKGKLGFTFVGDEKHATDKLHVKHVLPNGAAADDGRLQEQDELECVNDEIVVGLPFNEVVKIIKAREDGVKLVVSRDCIYTNMKPVNGSYGMGFRGGVDLGFPIVISKITPNSPADENDAVQLGREITHINKISLEFATHDDVLRVIKSADPEEGIDLIIHPIRRRKTSKSKRGRGSKTAKVQPTPTTENNVIDYDNFANTTTTAPTNTNTNEDATTDNDIGDKNGQISAEEEAVEVRVVDESLFANADAFDVDVEVNAVDGPNHIESNGKGVATEDVTMVNDSVVPDTFGDDVEDTEGNTSNYKRRDSYVLERGKYFDRANTILRRKLIKGSYQTIPRGRLEDPHGFSCRVGRFDENKLRNRYRDIIPFDDTRVVLKDAPNDYFNGSHIQFKAGEKDFNYIACQGPKPNTADHFWKVVWDNGVRIVVMVTNLTEGGRSKCFQYWPEEKESQAFGDYEVTTNAVLDRPGFVIRDFHIRYNKSKRRMFQFQFLGWPDHGIPADGKSFLEFVREIEAFKCRLKKPMPLLVHCSAGVGRTGVFILTELGLALLRANNPVNLSQILIELRRQRAILVQTTSQYDFVFNTLKDVKEQNGPDFDISP
eukprot:m.170240 g.170240  ORF g.170240 m.170240 type:complete len:1259 (+) comp13487_c7_seq1:79-3855(+)